MKSERLKSSILLIQFCLYLAAIGFSAGGGNYPGAIARSFIYLKGLFLILPSFTLLVIACTRLRQYLPALVFIVRQNSFLVLYFFVAMLFLPFAVNKVYSMERLIYSIAGMLALFSIILQYYIILGESKVSLNAHINKITFFVLLYPCYIFYAWLSMEDNDFRKAFQSTLLIHANIYSSFCAHLLIWHIGVLFFSSHKLKSFLFSSALIFIIYILFSRTVLISVILAIPVGLMIYYLIRRNINVLVLMLLLMAMLLSFLITINFDERFLNYLMEIFARDKDIASLITMTNRTMLWQMLFENLSLQKFLFGHGYAVINENFGIDFGTGVLYGAHNAYLSVILGSGLFALLVLVFYLFTNVVRITILRNQIPVQMFFCALLSYFIFMVNCTTAEEIGINTSVTFAYLIFLTNMCFFYKYKADQA